MTTYVQIRLDDHTIAGPPGPLPYLVANWSREEVAELVPLADDAKVQFGLVGMGFWPLIVTPVPFDPSTQTLTDPNPAALTVDAAAREVHGTAKVVALPADEIASNLETAQQAKLAELSAACAAQIVGGYTSSALGAVHTYPSKDTDQANMVASVVKSGLPSTPADTLFPFWCADSTGAWAMRSHSVAKIQQAGSDGFAAIAAAQVKNATLGAEVMAATTVVAVEAIGW